MDNNFYTKKGDILGEAATHLFYAVRQLELAVEHESTVNPDGGADLNDVLAAARASFKDSVVIICSILRRDGGDGREVVQTSTSK